MALRKHRAETQTDNLCHIINATCLHTGACASGAPAAAKDMGGRQLEGTRTAVGWFGSKPKEPLVLERGRAALPSPSLPHPPLSVPFHLPQLTRAPSPPPPPRPPPPASVLCAAHAGLAPGCPSWPCCEQPEPERGRRGTGKLFRTLEHSLRQIPAKIQESYTAT